MENIRIGARKEFFLMVLLQTYFTFIQSLKLLVVSALIIGFVVAVQAQIGLSVFGKLESLGQVLNTVLFREVTPLFITIFIIIRSITAITSDIATMKATNQIEALEFMGIDINDYLVRPRIFAGSISFFCMSFTFFVISLLGFWAALNINSNISLDEITFFFIKTIIIGGLVVALACKHGLSLQNATFEIPIVTNRSVVQCLIYGIGLQMSFTAIAYLMFEVGI